MDLITPQTSNGRGGSPMFPVRSRAAVVGVFPVLVSAVSVLALCAAARGFEGFNIGLAIEGTFLGIWSALLAVHATQDAERIANCTERLEVAVDWTNNRTDLERLDDVMTALEPLRFRRRLSSPQPSSNQALPARVATANRYSELGIAVRSAAATALPHCQILLEALPQNAHLGGFAESSNIDLNSLIHSAYEEVHSAREARLMRLSGPRSRAKRAGTAHEALWFRSEPGRDRRSEDPRAANLEVPISQRFTPRARAEGGSSPVRAPSGWLSDACPPDR